MKSGRPLPPNGQADLGIMDWKHVKASVLADGKLTAAEIRLVFRTGDALAARTSLLSETYGAALALMSGRDGIRSERFQERMRAAARSKVIAFPERSDPLEAA